MNRPSPSSQSVSNVPSRTKSDRSDTGPRSSSLAILLRGARRRCPRCSQGGLYERWNVFKNHCEFCQYGFEEREGNCWFFLYSTTAALTGFFIVVILLWRPDNVLLGRFVLGSVSILIIVFSLPIRKGIALALEYLSEQKGSQILLYDNEDEKQSDR